MDKQHTATYTGTWRPLERRQRSMISVTLKGSIGEADGARWRACLAGEITTEENDRLFRQQVKQVTKLILTAPEFAGCKIAFSRTAGCRCGCSPGWIFKDGTAPKHNTVFYVTIDDAPEAAPEAA